MKSFESTANHLTKKASFSYFCSFKLTNPQYYAITYHWND